MTIRYATATRTSRMSAVNTAVGSNGKLTIYTGSQPASPQAAVTGTPLAVIPCAVTTPGNTSTPGELNFTTAGMTVAAIASGTPGWAALTTSADVRIVDLDCTVGAGGNLTFSAAIVSGGTVTVTSLKFTDGTS